MASSLGQHLSLGFCSGFAIMRLQDEGIVVMNPPHPYWNLDRWEQSLPGNSHLSSLNEGWGRGDSMDQTVNSQNENFKFYMKNLNKFYMSAQDLFSFSLLLDNQRTVFLSTACI